MISILDVYKDEEKKQANSSKCIAYLNAAMCELKIERYRKAKEHCQKALEIDSLNVKGLYRKAMVTCFLSPYIFVALFCLLWFLLFQLSAGKY